MKVNPIGIQSYQQLTNRQTQTSQKLSEQQSEAVADKKVTISPQENAGSRIAVKANSGNYSEYLSPEEKNALDILFSRFKDSERFGTSFNSDTQVEARQKTLGIQIDLKV